MVDFSSAFISQAENYIGAEDFKRVGKCFVESLHTFTPCEGKYDLVWIQWVSGHLTDGDLVAFFERLVACTSFLGMVSYVLLMSGLKLGLFGPKLARFCPEIALFSHETAFLGPR
jgi:hypothetical protein